MKKYLFGIIALAMVVGLSAFTTKKSHKPFTPTAIYYHGSDQLIATGTSGNEAEPKLNSMTETQFKTQGSWNATSVTPTANAAFVSALIFEREPGDAETNGGSDGQLTLAEALTAVWAYYVTNSNLPTSTANTIDVGSVSIVVERSSSIH